MNSIPNYEECVKYALSMKGITGDNFKDTDLRVFVRDTANPGTVFTALRKGGIVIPIVKASLLGEYNVEKTATVVIKANQINDMRNLYSYLLSNRKKPHYIRTNKPVCKE